MAEKGGQGVAEGPAFERYLEAAQQRLCGAPGAVRLTPDESVEVLKQAQNQLASGDVEGVTLRLCAVLEARITSFGLTAPRTLAVFNNFAVLLRTQGRSGEARDLLEHLMEAASAYPPAGHAMARRVMHNLGTALYSQGYMRQAERVLRAALAKGEDTAEPAAELGPTITNLAFALEAQGRFAEAEVQHRHALELRLDAGLLLESAASMNNLGSNLTAQGRLEVAEPLLRKALAVRRDVLGDDSLNVGFSLSALANNLLLQGRPREALVPAEAVVQLRRSALGEDHPETAAAFQLLATVCLEAGEAQRAVEYARRALAARVPETVREEAALSDAARSVLRRAPGAAAFTLARSAWIASKGEPRSWGRSPASNLASAAFLAAQRIPVSTTADALARAGGRRAAEHSGYGELAHRLETQLNARAFLDHALAEAAMNRTATVVDLRVQRGKVDEKIEATETELRRRFPQFFDYIRPQPVSLEALIGPNGPLGDDEILLVMTPGTGRARGLVWALTREGGAWAEIALDPADLEVKVRRFRQLLDLVAGRRRTQAAFQEPIEDFDWDGATALYDALFSAPEVAALAQNKGRWILAPQGVLLSVPFGALVTAPPRHGRVGANALRRASWLGLERVLSLTPSVSSLVTLRRQSGTTSAKRAFFGVGDPKFSEAGTGHLGEVGSYFIDRLADVEALRQLPSLPGTSQEITELARTLGALREDYLLDAEATEAEVKRRNTAGRLADVRVVAFATHGLVSGDLRNTLSEPALALTPPAVASESDDGLLTASEASELRLNAEWVILSACNTAAADRPNGEGLSGLARAFLLAGARSLLASHWRVPDDVAGRLTTRAIALVATRPGLDRAEALQQAMREIVVDTSHDETNAPLSHPGVWAAFAYIGS